MRSAGINFGIPDSEYIVRVDDTGAATNCYNQDTDTEYIGGGGGGGLSFQTANVSITFDASDVGGTEPTEFEQVICGIRNPNADSDAATLYFVENGLPVSLLGNLHNMTVPIYSGYGTSLYIDYGNMVGDPSIISGAAELIDGTLYILGDCSLTVKLGWQD